MGAVVGRHRRSRSRAGLRFRVALLVALSLPVSAAMAYWSVDSAPGGNGAAAATVVDPGATPSASAEADDVTVDWVATGLGSGQAVDGYLVKRYDAVTLDVQPTLSGCAGRLSATTCTETGVPPGAWRYSVTPVIGTNWQGGESGLSNVASTDSTPPVNAVTTSDVTGGVLKDGDTVYYRGVAAGSFTLTNTVTDAGSGPANSRTGAPTGDVGGWTHAPSTVASPSGGPYVSNVFSWLAGTSSTVGESVTGRDLAGNETVTALSFLDDSLAPAGAEVTYPDGFQPDQSVVVTLASGTDAGSGIALRQLQRSSSVLTAGVCGSLGGFADVGPADPPSPYTDTDVEEDTCYQYRYLVTDRLGNQAVAASASVAKFGSFDGGPSLRSTASYSVLAGTGVMNTLDTTLSGDLGLSTSGAIAGFPPGLVAGEIDDKNLDAAQAQIDLGLAYADAAARTATSSFAGDQINQTFHPGVHSTGAAFANTGTMTLDGGGDPNAVFIFQIGAAMSPAAGSRVVLIDGATAANVYWQVNGAVSVGANSSISGTLMANGDITLGLEVELIGRALATGIVTMADNTVRFTTALPPSVTIDGDDASGEVDVTKDTTPTITGSSDVAPGTQVTVKVAGQTLITTVEANGTWNVTGAEMGAGTYQVVATVRDGDGNNGSATQMLTVEVNPTPVALGSAGAYSALSGTSIVNTGTGTQLSGNAGVSPVGSITGLTSDQVGGSIEINSLAAAQALVDFEAAYAEIDGRTPDREIDGVLGGRTFRAGVYHSVAALDLTGTLVLDAENLPGQVFIFQGDAAMNTAALARVQLVNGAEATNVYFQVAGAVGTGAGTEFQGTFLSLGAVTLADGTTMNGRALSRGTNTMANTTIATPLDGPTQLQRSGAESR